MLGYRLDHMHKWVVCFEGDAASHVECAECDRKLEWYEVENVMNNAELHRYQSVLFTTMHYHPGELQKPDKEVDNWDTEGV